jgi:hypothetical protein
VDEGTLPAWGLGCRELMAAVRAAVLYPKLLNEAVLMEQVVSIAGCEDHSLILFQQ